MQLVTTCGASQIREGFLLFLFIVCRFLCFGPAQRRQWRSAGRRVSQWLPGGFCFVAQIIRFFSFKTRTQLLLKLAADCYIQETNYLLSFDFLFLNCVKQNLGYSKRSVNLPRTPYLLREMSRDLCPFCLKLSNLAFMGSNSPRA